MPRIFGRGPGALLPMVFLALALIFALKDNWPPQASGATGESAQINGATSGGYKPDKQTALLRDTNIAVVDTLTHANVVTLPYLDVQGRKNVPISARFSASSQTCKVRLAYYAWDGTSYFLLGLGPEYTLTGTAFTDANGRYVAEDLILDSRGAARIFLLVTSAPGSGNVRFGVGSYS